mgnify:CR=1 FL=1
MLLINMYSRNALRFLCFTSENDGLVLGHSDLCYAKVLRFGDIHPQCIDAFEGFPMDRLLSRQAISL